MAKITVMVPVELEVTVSAHGELRVGRASWPTLNKCSEYLEVLPKAATDSSFNILGVVGEYAIIQR